MNPFAMSLNVQLKCDLMSEIYYYYFFMSNGCRNAYSVPLIYFILPLIYKSLKWE
jgi:hypothetical protein